MNILYLAHRIPYPPNKGDKLRSFRQLEHLARNHRVWCACFVDTPSDRKYVPILAAFCWDVRAIPLNRRRAMLRGVVGMLHGRTITESFYAHPAMDQTLRQWANTVRFDVVVAFSSSMAPYGLRVPAKRRVLDLCDLDSQKWLDYAALSPRPRRWLYQIEGERLAIREREWLGAFDASIVITDAEAAAIPSDIEACRIYIVGNGVELSETRDSEHNASPNRLVVGFVGVMDYKPNVDAVTWFVDQCWGPIRQACPTAIFRIVGRSPTRRVRKLAKVPGVEVVGGVENVASELSGFDLSVAPMRIARGLQNKVLEAMAAAIPVVLTSKAAEGIHAQDGREYVVADTPDALAQRIAHLLEDPEERRRLGESARRFVANHHCWNGVLKKFELIVTGAIGPSQRSSVGVPKGLLEPPRRSVIPHSASLLSER